MLTRPATLTMLVLASALTLQPACGKTGNEPQNTSQAPAPRTPAASETTPAPGQKPEAGVPATQAPAATPATIKVPLDELAPGYRLKETELPPGTVARIGKQDLPAGTVKNLSKFLRTGGAVGHQDPNAVRTAALLMSLDELLAGKKLTEGKYAKEPRVRRLAEIYRLLYLAKRYEQQKIVANVAVSEAEIDARLPSSREELRLRLLVLNPENEAAIRAEFAAGTPFDQLVAKYSLTGGGAGMGEFGWQRRGQTIFGSEGEDLLWATPARQISPMLPTAIGPILAQVIERHTIPDADWAQARATTRDAIAGQRAAIYTGAIVKRHKIEPVFEEMRRIAAAMAQEDRATDAVVGRVDDVEVWFHDLDRMMEVSYQDIMMGATAEQIRSAYLGFFERVASGIALGLEARTIGLQLSPGDEDGLKAALGKASLKVALQDIVKGVAVGKDEIEKYYQEHRAQFSGVSAARLQVLVVKEMATALEIVERFRGGASFTELVARHSIDTVTQARGGDTGLKGADTLPPEVIAGLLETDEGELLPIYPSGGAFTVALVREKRQQAPLAEADAKAAIARNLLKKKRSDAVREYLVTLRGGEEVAFDRAQFEAIPLEKKVAMPSKHGGSHAMPSGHPAPGGGSGMPSGHPAPGGGGAMPPGHPAPGGGAR